MRVNSGNRRHAVVPTRRKKLIIALLAVCSSLCASAQGAADLAGTLKSCKGYSADAVFEVLLPSSQDPVVYNIRMQSDACTDSLSPCDYIIEWESESAHGMMTGFSAYFDGNHYRYRNGKLQEYHGEASTRPFLPNGPGSARQGVQSTAQFANLLPQFLAATIDEITTDTAYVFSYHPDTLVSGRHSIVLDGVKRTMGYDSMYFTYVFDKDSRMPVSSEITTSPGGISEQLVTVTYTPKAHDQRIEYSETAMMEKWPEEFEKFRTSTFRVENLVGTPLPDFASRRLGGERYHHNRGDGFSSPVIIAVLDPAVGSTKETIDAVREAVNISPRNVSVIFAFNTNRDEDVIELAGNMSTDEICLLSASDLIRKCGVTLYPTLLLVDREGNVRDVVTGCNKDLSSVVIQKLTAID